MFTKLGRDEVLMTPHMDLGVTDISTQGRIQGRGPFLKKTSFSGRKATATSRMYSNYLEACGMNCCLFLVPFQNFLRVHCTQVSDSGPLGLLFYKEWRLIQRLIPVVFSHVINTLIMYNHRSITLYLYLYQVLLFG